MEGIFLGIVVGLQLRFDWSGDWKRRITKTLFLPTLLLFYVLRARVLAPILIGALFFGWIGDLFMMFPSGHRWKMVGPVSFGIGHLFYTAAFIQYGGIAEIPLSGFGVLLFYPLWILVGYRLMGKNLKQTGHVFELAILYAGIIGCMSLFAFSMVFTQGTVLPFVGAMIFIASDTMVMYRKYGVAFPKNKFWVIATYMLAQILIVLGFVAI